MNKDNAKECQHNSRSFDGFVEDGGARALIQQAVEVELQAFLAEYGKVIIGVNE